MHIVPDDDELMPLNDPRVPPAVREHAQNLRPSVCLVVALGHDEFMLLDTQGKVVDLLWLK